MELGITRRTRILETACIDVLFRMAMWSFSMFVVVFEFLRARTMQFYTPLSNGKQIMLQTQFLSFLLTLPSHPTFLGPSRVSSPIPPRNYSSNLHPYTAAKSSVFRYHLPILSQARGHHHCHPPRSAHGHIWGIIRAHAIHAGCHRQHNIRIGSAARDVSRWLPAVRTRRP